MNGLIPTFEGKAPEPGTYRSLPSFRLHLLAGLSARQVELRLIERFDLRLPEARVIGLVGTFGALSLKEICQEADIEKSHASKLIARLVQRGLVEKLGDSADQRAISVRLSEDGRSLHATMYTDLQDRNAQWLSVLDASERAVLLAALEKLIAHTRDMMGLQTAMRSVPEAATPLAMDLGLARQLHQVLGELIDGACASDREVT